MENPLDYDDDDVTQSQFNQLLNAIIAANDNGSEEEIKALNELVQREVTAKPILARIVHDFSSLLSVVCTTCQCEISSCHQISNRSQSFCSSMGVCR